MRETAELAERVACSPLHGRGRLGDDNAPDVVRLQAGKPLIEADHDRKGLVNKCYG